MSQDMGGGSKNSLAARPSLPGRKVIPVAVLIAIVLSLCYFIAPRKPTPVAGIFAVTPQSAVTAQKLYAPAKQHPKLSRTIDAELGRIAVSRASTSGAYFTNLFLGFAAKLELKQHSANIFQGVGEA